MTAALDAEFDVFYQLPGGFVWCIAGCSVIGEHNGHPCTHCGGKGFHRDTQTPAGSVPPPRLTRQARTPGGVGCLVPTSTPLGDQKEAI